MSRAGVNIGTFLFDISFAASPGTGGVMRQECQHRCGQYLPLSHLLRGIGDRRQGPERPERQSRAGQSIAEKERRFISLRCYLKDADEIDLNAAAASRTKAGTLRGQFVLFDMAP